MKKIEKYFLIGLPILIFLGILLSSDLEPEAMGEIIGSLLLIFILFYLGFKQGGKWFEKGNKAKKK